MSVKDGSYRLGGDILSGGIDIRLFEGEAIVNRHGKVIGYVQGGLLVRPKEEIYVDEIPALVERDQSGWQTDGGIPGR